ncbi:MAG: hypothetical protein GQ470_06905 [Gammaproteobacteria bacterium]|nr:hypothetical protein [Gammaproteobacteria bacterium]
MSLGTIFGPFNRLYRLLILAILIIIFVRVAIDSIWKIRVAAERTHVAWMFGTMQSAIGLEVATRAVKGGLAEIARLDQSNPFELLDTLKDPMIGAHPYLGELNHPDPQDIAPGSWYFDTKTRVLNYRVLMDELFVSDLSGPARIRFALRGHYTSSGDFKNIALVALDEYRWMEPE